MKGLSKPQVGISPMGTGVTAALESQLWSLSNGRFGVGGWAAGACFATLNDLAIIRSKLSAGAEGLGQFLYLRDLESGAFWSLTHQPMLDEDSRHSFRLTDSGVEFVTRHQRIASTMRIVVRDDLDVEFRIFQLTNLGDDLRLLDLTSYCELVLGDRAADAAHPAFSKLFVETSFAEDSQAIVARRRPRDTNQRVLWAAQTVYPINGHWADDLQFETDRARFIGRGRTLALPAALHSDEELSGTLGPVLDPIFSTRQSLSLLPGATAELSLALVAAESETELHNQLGRLREVSIEEQLSVVGSQSGNADEKESSNGFIRIDPASLNQLVSRLDWPPLDEAYDARRAKECQPPKVDSQGTEDLQFFNGIGGFAADGKEYVIRLSADQRGMTNLPPMPWSNVVANEHAGFICTETGAGCTWARNSRENRITPWSNDPIADPHSEAIYIRDEEREIYWSPLPGPTPHPGTYEVRHGFGYSKYLHFSEDLDQEVTVFVPQEAPVKIARLRLTNSSSDTRRLSVFAYCRWDTEKNDPEQTCVSEVDQDSQAIFLTKNTDAASPEALAFHWTGSDVADEEQFHCTDAEVFLGPDMKIDSPESLRAYPRLREYPGVSRAPCAAQQIQIELAVNQSQEVYILLGEVDSPNAARELVAQYGSQESVESAFHELEGQWKADLSGLQIETPSPAIDWMVNGWLPYQNLSCRLRGRSSFYQSGGAYGFRDQLQDASAFVYQWPELTRKQILLHASQQFVEGDVLHWWHPPGNYGLRTRFSDDLLWLPLIATEYVTATGDESIWDEEIGFLTARSLSPGEVEALLSPRDSGESGTLFEHCCRAIDISLEVGCHGLPLMGCGDWNDGMNRVGAGGQGESVWLGFFLYKILGMIIPWCQRRGEGERMLIYQQAADQLELALGEAGWDGGWYRRAFFDDGTPVGSAESKECQVDALVQAWSVLSGAAPTERARQAMQAVEDRLICNEEKVIRLLHPAFDQMVEDPGYIKGYLPGIRENGGQYTHGVLWFVRAMAEMGNGSRAVELLEMLTPVNHARTPEEVTAYKTEPYVIAADVYGQRPHLGRGGWSWYTGSAGWMCRVAIESILGFKVENGSTLILNPCISSHWTVCRISYRTPKSGATYKIEISNKERCQRGISTALLDGQTVAVQDGVARIPLIEDGGEHHVDVSL